MAVAVADNASVTPAKNLLSLLCDGISPRDFAIRYWDGTTVGPDSGQPTRFTLVLNHAGSVRQMLWPFNKAAVGEAYIYDDIDIEGDIEAFIEMLMHWRAKRLSPVQKLSILRKLTKMPNESRRNSDRGVKLTGSQRTEARDR